MRTENETCDFVKMFEMSSRLRQMASATQTEAEAILKEHSSKVSAGQTAMMFLIRRHKSLSISQICHFSGSSQPAVSRMIGLLKKAGMVKGSACLHDARQLAVELTDDGEHFIDHVEERAGFHKVDSNRLVSLLECLGQLEKLVKKL